MCILVLRVLHKSSFTQTYSIPVLRSKLLLLLEGNRSSASGPSGSPASLQCALGKPLSALHYLWAKSRKAVVRGIDLTAPLEWMQPRVSKTCLNSKRHYMFNSDACSYPQRVSSEPADKVKFLWGNLCTLCQPVVMVLHVSTLSSQAHWVCEI